ncbi:hypothetical protein ABDK00_013995 [Niabella insulamsoli]|uniref:hypothetical protein n=1 Tax=Niabella insulamsoli TaxID=3144874 RepID=UPI0031FBBD6B
MKTLLIKHWPWLIACLLCWVIGFFMGRANSDVIKKIVYVKGNTVEDSLIAPKPIKSEIPADPVYPTKNDTVWMKGQPGETIIDSIPYQVIQKVDTSKIISEYITLNQYDNTLFDNSNGKLSVRSNVQYNKLQRIDYSFTPIQKEITIERKRTFTPFITGSYNTFNQAAAGAGIYIKNIGIGAKYIKDLSTDRTGYEGGIYIKF